MNLLHYPDQQRCKKLTDIGFPETECGFVKEKTGMTDGFVFSKNYGETNNQWYDRYVCPSVMEMLDFIPRNLPGIGVPHLSLGKDWAEYIDGYGAVTISFENSGTLPCALADLIFWLKENHPTSLPF